MIAWPALNVVAGVAPMVATSTADGGLSSAKSRPNSEVLPAASVTVAEMIEPLASAGALNVNWAPPSTPRRDHGRTEVDLPLAVSGEHGPWVGVEVDEDRGIGRGVDVADDRRARARSIRNRVQHRVVLVEVRAGIRTAQNVLRGHAGSPQLDAEAAVGVDRVSADRVVRYR